MEWIKDIERVGGSIRYKDVILTPVSRSFMVSVPGLRGGILWNRPAFIQVQHENGDVQLLPVQDVTRQVVLSIAVFGLILGILLRIIRRN